MRKINILIVDDAAFTRDLIKKGIRTVFPHFVLDEAIDGKQAMNKIAKHAYDMILCDWEMPNVSGDELLQWLRGESNRKTTPFIMVTSRGDKEHVVKAIQLGVNNYLTKPFTTEYLIKILAKELIKHTKMTPEELRTLGGDTKGGLVNQSSNVILEAQEQAKSRATTDETPGGLSGDLPIKEVIKSDPHSSKAPQRVTPSDAKRAIALVRFQAQQLNCLIADIGLDSARVITKHEGHLPQLLEAVSFDFEGEDGEVSRLNGYVHALQSKEPRPDSEYAFIVVGFVDEDADKHQRLEEFIRLIG